MTIKPPKPPIEPPGHPSLSLAGRIGRQSPFARPGMLPEPPAGEQEFDALTDLFLGEIGGRGGPKADLGADTAPAPENDRPKLRLRRETDDDVLVAAPLAVPVVAAAARTIEPTLIDDIPLPGVPTFAPAAGPIPAPTPIGDPIVECIVLGHLPVLGAAWASQYVREVAQAAGRPVAVLRVQAGYASVELIGARVEHVRRIPHAAPTAEAAVRTARTITDRWIVRCDPGDEIDLAARSAVRMITLLTGGDEAARVGAYASIKSLAERLAAPTAENPGPLVRVAIMGAAGDAAAAAGGRITEAVRTFLKRDIDQVVCAGRIGSSRPALLLYSGPAEGGFARVLALLDVPGPDALGEIVAPSAASISVEQPEAAAALTADDSASAAQLVEAELIAQTPLHGILISESLETTEAPTHDNLEHDPIPESEIPLAEVPLPDPPASTSINTTPASPPEPAGVRTELRPEPETARTAETPWDMRRNSPAPAKREPPALVSTISGLHPLSVRCPYARSVDLAIDDRNTLHLLVQSGVIETDDTVLASLFVAASWAEAHAPLLAFAAGAPLSAGGRPVLHLFTANPKRSRRLLDTGVRVHLLAPVAVDDRTTWFCTDLN